MGMSDVRINQAFDRIEKALARIETQAALSSHAKPSQDLARRHEALRQSVTASLAELDTLIEGMEQ